MKFNKEINQYLDGRKFDNGIDVIISDNQTDIKSRNDFIVELTENKKIVHLGCSNHLPLIDKMIANGTWLHARLEENCDRCYGIDINSEGITHIQKKHGYTDTICADIVSDRIDILENNSWDFMIIPDVLEHIDNPVEFLTAIKNKYQNNIGQLIITVPNAFDYKNIQNLKRHVENINTDHRYWFTPFTLAKVVSSSGMRMTDYYYADELPKRKRGLRAKLLLFPFLKTVLLKRKLKKYPEMSETIIAITNLK